jgi:hypothetical protein
VRTEIDHLILGVADLDRGIAEIERRTGVRAAPGGVHPGRGTRNAVLSLGPDRYLEIMAPDPAQPALNWFHRIAALREPALVGWAVHVRDLEGLARQARAAGIAIEGPAPGSRARPDGKTLRWKAFTLGDDRGGLLPFAIEWDPASPHPASDAPAGCSLEGLGLRSPAPAGLARELAALGVEVPVEKGEPASLLAAIRGPTGRADLAGS